MSLERGVDRSLLINAFLPSSGIEDPDRFAGRGQEIAELTDALLTTGSIPLIYGHRGLGKSSLALQTSRIAQGDIELLSQLGIERLALSESNRFITLYVTCSDSTQDLDGILQSMINAIDSIRVSLEKDARRSESYQLTDKTTKRGLSLKMFTAETTKSYEAKKTELDTSKYSPVEQLVRLADIITDVYKQKVLFILDEIDRVLDTTGLASFLKSYSSEFLKFALVGIGSTEADLLRDHSSLDRQLVPVRVRLMEKNELASIIERTEAFLSHNSLSFTFSEIAKTRLTRISAGFPWFIHLLGQASLIEADKTGVYRIDDSVVDEVVSQLPRGRFAKQYNDRYMAAVRDSQPREVLMRLFAEWRDEDIPTSEVYSRASTLGVANPAQYVGHLTNSMYGEVLVRVPRVARLYRFTDEMFKNYVRIRKSIYVDVDVDTKAAFYS